VILATYNIHRCVGSDGQAAPQRITRVIEELKADLVALQEVDAEFHLAPGVDQFEFLARATGMRAIAGPTLESGGARYGNALLTRLELQRVAWIDLSVSGREPRGAIDAAVETGVGPLRVLTTHLGLDPRERRIQSRKLASHLDHPEDGHDESPVVLLGDLNSVSGTSLAPLRGRMGRLARRRTYPARHPVLPLDRIWVWPAELLADLRVHHSPLARAASDHLPLRAELRFDA
jgi:endonuclease/exonuclease/phosphatase family metal-dependent hydrolase